MLKLDFERNGHVCSRRQVITSQQVTDVNYDLVFLLLTMR